MTLERRSKRDIDSMVRELRGDDLITILTSLDHYTEGRGTRTPMSDEEIQAFFEDLGETILRIEQRARELKMAGDAMPKDEGDITK